MKLETPSFGTLDYEEKSVIHFPEGLLGFAKFKDYLLVENAETQPFKWLQSLDDPLIAFPLVDPHLIDRNFACAITLDEIHSLQIEHESDVVSLAVAVIPEDPLRTTVNLKAPLVINHNKMLGKQVVLTAADYDTMVPIIPASIESGPTS